MVLMVMSDPVRTGYHGVNPVPVSGQCSDSVHERGNVVLTTGKKGGGGGAGGAGK